MQIEVKVQGQKIERLNSPGSVEDTLNYLTCHFVFEGEEWDDTVRTAYFQNPASGEKYPKILADDGTCTVPWEALTDKGPIRFSVAGERENYRITTGIESFWNSGTIYGGNPSEPPTPDQYDQLIALAQETKEIAESVREDADAGEFDGPPGPQGPKGEKGDPGPQGPAGKDGQNATDEQVQAAVDAYMEEHPIQADTEDIIKLAIKNEASGAVPISITDSAEMGVQDLEMQGWTEQNQYEGKNLFDISDFETNNKGIIENGTILFNQSLGTVMYYLNLNPGTYSISTKRSGCSGISIKINEVFVVNNGGSNNLTSNFDVSDGDSVVLEFSEGQNPNGEDRMIYDIMLNSGSAALPYEPYTGGQPSPSPDYPQPITSAGNYNEETQKYEYGVKLTGANLFDLTSSNISIFSVTKGTAQDIHNGVKLSYEKVRDSVYVADFTCEVGKTYFVSFDINVVSDILDGSVPLGYKPVIVTSNDASSWWNQDVFAVSYKIGTTHYEGVFTPDKECTMYISANNGTGAGSGYTEITNFMITEVEDADYEPYHTPQTVTLTADRPLTKWDKLEKRNGQWGWVYKSAEIVLDGNEQNVEGFVLRNETVAVYYVEILEKQKGSDNVIIDKMRYEYGAWGETTGEYTFSGHPVSKLIYLSIPVSEEGEGIKSWFTSNPLVLWYETEEETFVPLSETEQEALNALRTYYTATTVSNDVGCDMSLTYIADTKAYIDNKIAAIQAAVVNTI